MASGTDGNITWNYDESTTVLTISGTGAMNDYGSSSNFYPWRDYRLNITSVVISSGVTTIGDNAFNECTALTSITIANTVTSIGDSAFYKCTALTSITIPSSVTSIDSYAFQYCYSLTSITIPSSVTSISIGAFLHCKALKSIIFEGNSAPSLSILSFGLGSQSNPVTATVYTTGWGSDSVFTQNVKGAYTTFNYIEIYTVSFNSQGGSLNPPSQTLRGATSIILPSAGTNSDLIFKGWYTASSGGTLVGTVGSSYTVTSSITLYARWGSLVNVNVNVGGSWKNSTPYVNVGGTWKEVKAVYINVNGEWKEAV